MTTIADEASFLGFTRVARICRSVRTVLGTAIPGDSQLTAAQGEALKQSTAAIGRLVEQPTAMSTREVLTLVQTLASAFNVSVDDLSNPITDNVIDDSKSQAPRLVGEPIATHRDLGVYQSSEIDSLDHCFEEESWIVSQLASLAEDLASGNHAAHPANRLMHVLRGHKFFSQVDRVCLAGRVAGGNQLVVVDAALSARCEENALQKGYSCFVNPEGSLFKMKPGTVRIFGDSEMVLKSFVQQGKPAQRSIALVADQGLRSGLCLAIGRGTEIQGFLFLNSTQEDLFKTITVGSAPLLSLFGLVATIALDTSGFHLSKSSSHLLAGHLPLNSRAFDKDDFASLLNDSLQTLLGDTTGIKVNVRCESNHRFLYLPSTVIGTVAETLFRLNPSHLADGEIDIDVVRRGGEVHIRFDHHQASEEPSK